MLKNIRDWLYHKPQIETQRCDFEGDTMTTMPITTMDDATHELTEDLIPSGFSTLKYPKGTQIKEVPKESSLRHFLFPDGKIGWVDELIIRNVVTEKVTTPTPNDASDSDTLPQMGTLFGGAFATQIAEIGAARGEKSDVTGVGPRRQILCGFLRYDPPAGITNGVRADWIKITVDMADKRFWNIISDSPVKPISKCSTIMELFGMEKGDKLYSINGRDYIYTLKDMSFKDDVVICHVTNIFGEDLEYDTGIFHIYVDQDVLDRAIELTNESEKH